MTTTDQAPVPAAEGSPAERSPAEDRPALRRSREDRVLFGVCGGLGRYLGIDPVLVRIAFVLLVVFGGSGVLLYLVGLVAIPSETPGQTVAPGTATAVSGAAAVVGTVLVALGSLLLVGRIVPGLGEFFGPFLLVALGVLVILAGRR